jgi:hypothetical protein
MLESFGPHVVLQILLKQPSANMLLLFASHERRNQKKGRPALGAQNGIRNHIMAATMD